MTATMTIDDAKATIFGVLAGVAPEIDPVDVEHDVELDEQLDLDSMDYLNWLIGISKATGVEIPQRDASEFMTIDGAARYLVSHSAD